MTTHRQATQSSQVRNSPALGAGNDNWLGEGHEKALKTPSTPNRRRVVLSPVRRRAVHAAFLNSFLMVGFRQLMRLDRKRLSVRSGRRTRLVRVFVGVMVLTLLCPFVVFATPQTSEPFYFPQTDHYLAGGFLAYWEHFGGARIFGYPITDEFQEDGMTVQYFERARFEWHPGSDPSHYDVELGLVGTQTAQRYGYFHIATFAPAFVVPEMPISQTNCIYFDETQHNLCGGFRAYWQQFGGIATFGYPISAEFQESNPDNGTTYTVQYFQRMRFEWHPGSDPTYYDVQLGRVGVEALEMLHPDLIQQCHCEHP